MVPQTAFLPKLFRDDDRAFQFRAVVDDQRLGGTGVLWLKVWIDRQGMIDREPELNWERMPSGGGADLDTRQADAQTVLLARAARGEMTFRPDRRENARAFDETVEHILALQRLGLVTCDPPAASDRPGAQYAVVTNVALTDAGWRAHRERALRSG